MHLPSSVLGTSVCWVSAAASIAGCAGAAAMLRRAAPKTVPSSFAAITGLVFAAQMLNFPVSGGTSGHLVGGVLAGALLGPAWAVVSLAIVVTAQAALFGDGGLAALGCNLLNMALIGAGMGGWLYQKLRASASGHAPVAALAAGWASVLAASLAAAFQLALSGSAPLGAAVQSVVGGHLLIGLAEGALTAGLLVALSTSQRRTGRAAALMALVAVVASPLASSLPDGLEAALLSLQADNLAAPPSLAPFAGYTFPGLLSPETSMVLAGALGLAAVFTLAVFAHRLLARPQKVS